VSFTINHIAAIFVPVLLGFVWVYSNSLVFYVGALFAFLSLMVTQLMPSNLKKFN
ncbi:MFS transporter, partial [Alphaproteobacteria bacterium]|nr:MFS transporter [Alphaproteobacteria bacterium]